MPRRQRPDLQPEIQLADTADALRKAADAIGPGFVARVHKRDNRSEFDSFRITFGECERRLQMIRDKGYPIDEALLHRMMSQIDIAKLKPKPDVHGKPMVANGSATMIMMSVGCRLRQTQTEIARRHRCSRQHVCAQIKLMRDVGLIVNQGKGWYEFDARLCWRGAMAARNAYLDLQLNTHSRRRA